MTDKIIELIMKTLPVVVWGIVIYYCEKYQVSITRMIVALGIAYTIMLSLAFALVLFSPSK